MNDFLITQLAREHHARIMREAEAAAIVRSAEGARERSRSRRKGRWIHPRNG
jgi:hypothetical protein